MALAFPLFIVWLLAELFVAIQVGGAIGALPTVILLVAGWPIGMWVLRSRGGAAWQRLQSAVAEGRPPGHEALDGALIVVGGALLIVPGFISDLVAVCLLLPPTRALLRATLAQNIQRRLAAYATRLSGRSYDVSGRAYDVDSTAHDLDQPRLRP